VKELAISLAPMVNLVEKYDLFFSHPFTSGAQFVSVMQC
jgi:hypothetical protein